MVGGTLLLLEEDLQDALIGQKVINPDAEARLKGVQIPADFVDDPRILSRTASPGSSPYDALVLFDSCEGIEDNPTTFSAFLPTEVMQGGRVRRGWKPLIESVGVRDLRLTKDGRIGDEHQLLAVLSSGAAFVAEWSGDYRATVEWTGRYLSVNGLRGAHHRKAPSKHPESIAKLADVVNISELQAQA
jgi:hypothetical protein